MAEPIDGYVVTPHARFEMERRGIGDEVVAQVLGGPEQREGARTGRDVLPSRVVFPEGSYLVRVFWMSTAIRRRS